MKIAILTLPLHTNYGGILQAYALQTVLERIGHEVRLLFSPPYKAHSSWVMPLVYTKRIIQKFVLRKDVSIRYDGHNRPKQYTNKFIKKHIHSFYIRDWDSVDSIFDAYIVGSDQIWRPMYVTLNSPVQRAYLDFVRRDSVKRISYAASFGSDQWEYTPDMTSACKALVQQFDRVSVREESGVDLCREHFSIDAVHVLDPTMLLEEKDYSSLLSGYTQPKEPGLACYVLDKSPRIDSLIKDLSSALSLNINQLNADVDNESIPIKDRIQPPVEHWLSGIRNSQFVITDSFHACVFSIIFHRQFAIILNEARGTSRIYSLLKMFNLENRIIDFDESIDNEAVIRQIRNMGEIDYISVEKLLKEQKNKSMNFLRNAL